MWVKDDAGDLVNLDRVDCIIVAPITEDESRPDSSVTHEVLAVLPDQTSFRLGFGNETTCYGIVLTIALDLSRRQQLI